MCDKITRRKTSAQGAKLSPAGLITVHSEQLYLTLGTVVCETGVQSCDKKKKLKRKTGVK